MRKQISQDWIKFFETLNESQRRWFSGLMSQDLGHGGIVCLSETTGLSKNTIKKGLKEVQSLATLPVDKVRSCGGGRKAVFQETKIKKELDKILNETTSGDPMSSIKWTCKSVRALAEELSKKGYEISYRTVHRMLHEMGYSLQSNKKSLSQENNPNRDRQFKLINSKVAQFLNHGLPVISVDAKKKELVGNFKNPGQTWKKKAFPQLVEDHDFPSRGLGKAVPYGAYDIGRNEGFVNVGISFETAEFAVNSIKGWWHRFGKKHYPRAPELLICADSGGSNGYSNRLWKTCLQKFADQSGLKITVCHYPPGTSKWNKIEHRMFSYISLNWRGIPLETYETIVSLIGSTKTKTGLTIKAKLDKRQYKKGKKIPDEVFSKLNIVKNKVLPKWNYSVLPR